MGEVMHFEKGIFAKVNATNSTGTWFLDFLFPIFGSLLYLYIFGVAPSAKSTLISLRINLVHIGVTTDQLLLEQKFLIDIKYNSDHLLFPEVNHCIISDRTTNYHQSG